MKDYEEKVINIMDSAKDNIRTQLDKAYKSGYEDAKSELAKKAYKDGYEDAKSELGKKVANIAHEESDRAYQQGLEDAWEAARKLVLSSIEGGLDTATIDKIFDGLTYYAVFKAVSAAEAIAKIKEYEQQKQDTVQVGDEIIDKTIGRAIVLSVTPCFEQMSVLTSDGSVFENLNICIGDKTGRHFDQLAEVLAEMRGEE